MKYLCMFNHGAIQSLAPWFNFLRVKVNCYENFPWLYYLLSFIAFVFVDVSSVDSYSSQETYSTLSVSQHMHKISNLKNFCSIGHLSCEIIMKEKTPLSPEVVCFPMLDFETSNSKSEVSKSNSWKITSFSKTTSLQKEPFLTMFYSINLSPLLVTK